ncbi:hypothetical protein N9069_01210 [bacterium]|nr:hypothetical protein [bacterium]
MFLPSGLEQCPAQPVLLKESLKSQTGNMNFGAFDVGIPTTLTTSIQAKEHKPEKADDKRTFHSKANVEQDAERLGVRFCLTQSARIQYFHTGSNLETFNFQEINFQEINFQEIYARYDKGSLTVKFHITSQYWETKHRST